MERRSPRLLCAFVASAAVGCSGAASIGGKPTLTDAEYEAQITQGMHSTLLTHIDELLAAARDVQDAAPTPDPRGWDPSLDEAALASMKAAWARARSAYELVEGAIAPLFPDIDASIDARYDDFLTELGPSGDTDLFDGEGVTGMHAVERILWSDETPPRVVEFEQTLPGYSPAMFPADSDEAAAFDTKLCAQLVFDVESLQSQWQPVRAHIFIAFQGLISLMNEQREKVRKAASNEEESRYSQRTMQDIRDNLAGTRAVFTLFEPWLLSKPSGDAGQDGPAIDAHIEAGFRALADAYAAVPGDSMPAPPPTWSSETPSASDLGTPFGRLFAQVNAAVDPSRAGGIVAEMNAAAALLGAVVPAD